MCGISDIGHLGRLCVCVLFWVGLDVFRFGRVLKCWGFAGFVCFALGGG